MIEGIHTKLWQKMGMVLSVVPIVLALFAWFFAWAAGEYHARGGVTASLGFLYLPEYARKETSVYSVIHMSLRNRGLFCGAAAIPASIVAIIMCARSHVAVR